MGCFHFLLGKLPPLQVTRFGILESIRKNGINERHMAFTRNYPSTEHYQNSQLNLLTYSARPSLTDDNLTE